MARKKKDRKNEENKQILYAVSSLLLFMLLTTTGVILYMAAEDAASDSAFHAVASQALVPFSIGAGIIVAVLIAIPVLEFLRCPDCERFFSRGKLELNRTYQNQGPSFTSNGGTYYRQTTVREFKTHCRYCGYTILVRRQG
ncbi:MAG: hypothetical protein JXA20_07165 [Spirochaetes bacterium]|nr:hypothetical protein [Spirochaetota bacterium]